MNTFRSLGYIACPAADKPYAASAQRFANIVAQAGVDVHIANHTNRDNSPAKMAALEKVRPASHTPTWSAPSPTVSVGAFCASDETTQRRAGGALRCLWPFEE
jgi:hypothetical protein